MAKNDSDDSGFSNCLLYVVIPIVIASMLWITMWQKLLPNIDPEKIATFWHCVYFFGFIAAVIAVIYCCNASKSSPEAERQVQYYKSEEYRQRVAKFNAAKEQSIPPPKPPKIDPYLERLELELRERERKLFGEQMQLANLKEQLAKKRLEASRNAEESQEKSDSDSCET